MTAKSGDVIRGALKNGDAAFIAYYPLGYPTVSKSVEAIKAIVDGGADIVEIGFPYSDPGMDGPVIQHATTEALKKGTHLEDLFDAVKELSDYGVSVVSMTYWNPVNWFGVKAFADKFAAVGGAGLITPDLPPDDAQDWIEESDRAGLERIFLAAPTSSDHRLELIARESTGWIYAASTMGVTGTRSSVDNAARGLVQRCRDAGAELVCVGLGISNGEQAREVAEYADGVIVGSALVRPVVELPWELALDRLRELSAELKAGTVGVRK